MSTNRMKDLIRHGVLQADPVELSFAIPYSPGAVRSRAEIDELLLAARPRLYRLALAICADAHLAEDITQDTLIRASRARQAWLSAASPDAWLRLVLVRRAMSALKRPKPQALVDIAVADHTDLTISVRQTLDRLDAVDRTVLALSHFEQLSYDEIATALDIPVGTVASRLHSARKAFKEAWQS